MINVHFSDNSYPDMHVLKEAKKCLPDKLKSTSTHWGVRLKRKKSYDEKSYRKIPKFLDR